MSSPSPTKRGGSWNEAEKYQFLLKIIGQIGGGAGGALKGVHPKFDEIDLHGRTPKAMSLMWNKIKNEIPITSNSTKAPASTPRKRKANGDAAGTPASKKKTPTKKGGRKSRKNESDEDTEVDMPDLGDTEEEDAYPLGLPEEEDNEDDFVRHKDEDYSADNFAA